MINVTWNVEIIRLLDSLLIDIQGVLGSKLKGLYLYGSLVWGDFDYSVSDIDLLAVTSDDLTISDYDRLKEMHNHFAKTHPFWDNQIEVQYASISGLKTFRSVSSKMANISPGEPFHVIDAGIDWLTNWYFVQEYGLTLFGPHPSTFIPPITKEEFVQAVYDHALFWTVHVKQTKELRPYQSYAVLTLCRALYTTTFGEQVSKQKAADWAMTQLPEWADFIREALHVRSHGSEIKSIDASVAYPKTELFVQEAVERIKKIRG
jgi:hypothetical protein